MDINRAQWENLSYIPLKSFETKTVDGQLQIVNAVHGEVIPCNKKRAADLLAETATIATTIANSGDTSLDCETPDFFANNKDHPITKQILEYHKRFGIPQNPSDILPLISMTASDNAQTEKAGYPLSLSLRFFLGFYNRFIAGQQSGEVNLNTMSTLANFQPLFSFEHKRLILHGTKPGFWNATYTIALTKFLAGKSYEVCRICKHCNRWFSASRSNAQYCSAQCRNNYNVKQSLQRRKDRESKS